MNEILAFPNRDQSRLPQDAVRPLAPPRALDSRARRAPEQAAAGANDPLNRIWMIVLRGCLVFVAGLVLLRIFQFALSGA